MKRIIVMMCLALFLFGVMLIASCSKDEEEQVPDNNTPSLEEDYSDALIQTREDTELSFFSFFGREGFDSYILSFPTEWMEKEWASEMSERTNFFKDMDKAIAKLAEDRVADYGESFEFGFDHILDEKIEGDEFEALKRELEDYGVTADSVTEAVRAHYSTAYFSDAEKTQTLRTSSIVLTLVFIDGEGWFVSPANYIKVEL